MKILDPNKNILLWQVTENKQDCVIIHAEMQLFVTVNVHFHVIIWTKIETFAAALR